jgi:KaiC/GvpD/RAD55 family RecA-like ATPase
LRLKGAAAPELSPFPDEGVDARAQDPWFHPGVAPLWTRPRPEPVQGMRTRIPLGLRSVDEFLGGGVPAGSTVAVIGPPFGGKRTLACQFLAASIAQGAPALAMVTDGDLSQWRQGVANLVARVPEDRRGLACYLDLFGAGNGPGSEPFPIPEQVLSAIQRACESLPSDRRRLVLDSFSTVVALAGFSAAFSMLMRLLGQMRREGATTLLLVEAGAHSPMELQLIKRQADGAIEFRQYGGLPELQITGLGLAGPSPWLQGRSENGPVAVPVRG